MRTVQFTEYGEPGVVHLAEVEAPHAGRGEIRVAVRASGLSAGEAIVRSGTWRDLVPLTFPYRTGVDAAGVVDEVGDGVTAATIGDEVFGMTDINARGANSDLAVLTVWAPKPKTWSWEEAGGAAGGIETSVRVLDRLGVTAGQTLLVQGAAGGTGAIAVQFAVARGATVIGTAGERNHDFLRSLGVEPTTYGPGLADRVRALAPGGVDAVLDCAGGALPDLIAIAGDAARVVTIADLNAAAHGVHLSRTLAAGDEALGTGADPSAPHGLATAVDLASQGRLRIPVAAAFPLADAASAHELSDTRHARGKIVLVG